MAGRVSQKNWPRANWLNILTSELLIVSCFTKIIATLWPILISSGWLFFSPRNFRTCYKITDPAYYKLSYLTPTTWHTNQYAMVEPIHFTDSNTDTNNDTWLRVLNNTDTDMPLRIQWDTIPISLQRWRLIPIPIPIIIQVTNTITDMAYLYWYLYWYQYQ